MSVSDLPAGAATAAGGFQGLLRAYLARARANWSEPGVARRAIWLSLLPIPLFLLQIPVFAAIGFTVDWGTILGLAAVCLVAFGLSQLVLIRLDPVLAGIIAAFGQFSMASVAALAYTYASAASGLPFHDAGLMALDKAFGFDWAAWMDVLRFDPDLSLAATVAYSTLDRQALFVSVVAMVALRFRDFQTFAIAWLIAAAIVVVLSGLLPSLGPFHYLGIVDEMQSFLRVNSGYVHLAQIEAIRAGEAVNPYAHVVGIVTFPSFHAAGGVMLAWMFWRIPYLRWPMLAVNSAMILATPFIGSHYLADVIAGIAIAALALTIASRITRPRATP
jgi:hypothetical protein